MSSVIQVRPPQQPMHPLIEMTRRAAVLAIEAVHAAAAALTTHKKHLFDQVRACEAKLDVIDREFDEEIVYAVTNNTVAQGRELLCCFKFIIDLERIGDLVNSFSSRAEAVGSRIDQQDFEIQQYASQAFVYRRVRFLLLGDGSAPEEQKRRTRLAIFVNAAIFSSAHAPNLSLMTLTFAGGLIWSWVYERAPNLPAIALSHAAVSMTMMTSMPPWLLPSMSVGYKHFLYQKF